MRRVEIDKPDGGKRELGIPTVIDRVTQQAIAQILMPLFDPGFSADSYGFRPGRNAHQAVRRVQSVLKEGRRFTVDVDLSKFFDRVNHDLLMTHLGHKVRDKRLLGLIARYLRSGSLDSSPRANGLLATVAQAANQSQEPDEAGRSRAIGRSVWHHQQRTLAQLEDTWYSTGIV